MPNYSRLSERKFLVGLELGGVQLKTPTYTRGVLKEEEQPKQTTKRES